MRLSVIKKKSDTFYYVIESLPGGSSRIYEKIGRHSDLLKVCDDPAAYARSRVAEINEAIKGEVMLVNEEVDFSERLPECDSPYSKPTVRNVGWLYLGEILDSLGVDRFFAGMRGKRKYDPGLINRFLVVNQTLSPGSKLSAWGNLGRYAGIGKYDLHQSYRFLSDLDEHKEELQAYLFAKTKEAVELDTSVLMYDLTNFYFETEEEDIDFLDGDNILQYGFRKYGKSKENRPNPIVHMGLFVDRNGIPIGFCTARGSASEQETVPAMESRIVRDYRESSFIYCSDAGLNSYAIRFINAVGDRHYVVAHSLKKTEEGERKLIFSDLNWRFVDDDSPASLDEIRSIADKVIAGESLSPREEAVLKRDIVYKRFPTKHSIDASRLAKGARGRIELEETLYVTFSAKFYLYQSGILTKQVSRAEGWVEKGIAKRKGQNDPARLIKETSFTDDGVVAERKEMAIDGEAVDGERRFHGFYAVATDMDKPIGEILKINGDRWLIEYCFRILKSFFEARPMYVYTKEHINGHLTICYEALLVFQILSAKLDGLGEHHSAKAILETLRNMNVACHKGKYYEALYTDSKVLRALEKAFRLKLDRRQYKAKRFDEQ